MIQPFLKPQQPTERNILTISQLNRQSKGLLENHFSSLWLTGEISNFTRAASGHWYFSLKDNDAQIRCAMFRFKTQNLRFQPKEGDNVVVKGKVTLYEARGEYQFVADFMEPAGLGDLQQKLNQLIETLNAQGLFAQQHKKQLPKLPKKIGVITSPTGAAIHDVLSVLARRCPMIPIIIYPTQVQGVQAVEAIVSALDYAETRNECDVLLITRGGGSLEDLWCFNDEKLAHRIFNSKIPTIAAIGHEVDTSIAELVADARAPTPSAAAELLAPEQTSLQQQIDNFSFALINALKSQLHALQIRLNVAMLKLKDPEQAIKSYTHRLEKIESRMIGATKEQLLTNQKNLTKLQFQVANLNPIAQLKRNEKNLIDLKHQLLSNWKIIFETKHRCLRGFAGALNSLSPLSTLNRGYSIVLDQNHSIINSVEQVDFEQMLTLRVTDGQMECYVKKITPY